MVVCSDMWWFVVVCGDLSFSHTDEIELNDPDWVAQSPLQARTSYPPKGQGCHLLDLVIIVYYMK